MVLANNRNVHQGVGAPRKAVQIHSHLYNHAKQRLGPAVGRLRLLGGQKGRADISADRLADVLLHRHHIRHGRLICYNSSSM